VARRGKLNGEVARRARHPREDHREDVGHIGEDFTRMLQGRYEETASVEFQIFHVVHVKHTVLTK